jgi:hypothetical protein
VVDAQKFRLVNGPGNAGVAEGGVVAVIDIGLLLAGILGLVDGRAGWVTLAVVGALSLARV